MQSKYQLLTDRHITISIEPEYGTYDDSLVRLMVVVGDNDKQITIELDRKEIKPLVDALTFFDKIG